MPQRIEQAGGFTAIWGSVLTVLGQILGWASANATLCGLLIAFGGLIIQASAARHTRKLRDAEEQRKREEHALKMQLLQAELSEQHPR